jgi:hypothetical protein
MSFERLAENRIREAMAEGAFDDLANAGQPLDLESYFALPAHLRMGYSILKSANCLPQEVELLNDVARLERAVAEAPTEEARAAARKAANERRLQLSILLEQQKRQARIAAL